MIVRFIQSLISNISPYRVGDVADLDNRTAEKYIKAGICVPVKKVQRAQARPQAQQAIEQQTVSQPKRKRRTRAKK